MEERLLSEERVQATGADSGDARPFKFPVAPWRDLVYEPGTPGASEAAIGLPRLSAASVLVVGWAYGLMLLVLVGACHGVVSIGLKVRNFDLNAGQVVLTIFMVVFFAYVEGMSFHRSWSPYVVRRALLLPQGLSFRSQPVQSLVSLLLGPLFVAGLFFASKKRLAVAYLLYPSIVGFIIGVVNLPDPYHQITDVGVSVGLTIGTASLAYHFERALQTQRLPRDLDVPLVAPPASTSAIDA